MDIFDPKNSNKKEAKKSKTSDLYGGNSVSEIVEKVKKGKLFYHHHSSFSFLLAFDLILFVLSFI